MADIALRDNGAATGDISLSSGSGSNYTANINETVSLVEALAVAFATSIDINETVSLSENITTSLATEVSLSETVSLAELLAAIRNSIQLLNESVALSEVSVTQYNARPSVSETVTASDSVTVRRGMFQTLSLRSISSQVAPLASPERQAVRMVNSRHRALMPSTDLSL